MLGAFGDTDEAEPNQTQGQGGPEESENAQNSEETAENDADADQEYDQHSKSDDILNSLGHDDLLSRIDHGKLAQMQLIKRYYVDARTFIRLLESGARDGEGEDDADDDLRTRGAVDKITELLNSTTKSEVLEAMNFLTTAKRYNIAAADVSLMRSAILMPLFYFPLRRLKMILTIARRQSNASLGLG